MLWQTTFSLSERIKTGKKYIFAFMSGEDDLLAKLRETLNEQGIDSFHILEELIPIEEQMEYFRFFDRLRKENNPFVRDEEVAILFSPDQSIERKKRSLTLLASIPDVGAFRSIETYHSSPLGEETYPLQLCQRQRLRGQWTYLRPPSTPPLPDSSYN